jgi:Leucine-rich repeat (LRR) protein
MCECPSPQDLINRLISFLDKSGDGVLQASEFLALLRRARPEDNADPGIRPLTQLESINLSGNPISSLLGLEGHPCLRQVNMAGTGIKELQDVVHVQSLPVLQVRPNPLCSASCGVQVYPVCSTIVVG